MKLDVLDGFETVRLGVGYEYKGERIDIMPVGAEEVAQCKVIYEDFPGWKEPTFGITKWEDLPVNAQEIYLSVRSCRLPDRSCFYRPGSCSDNFAS